VIFLYKCIFLIQKLFYALDPTLLYLPPNRFHHGSGHAGIKLKQKKTDSFLRARVCWSQVKWGTTYWPWKNKIKITIFNYCSKFLSAYMNTLNGEKCIKTDNILLNNGPTWEKFRIHYTCPKWVCISYCPFKGTVALNPFHSKHQFHAGPQMRRNLFSFRVFSYNAYFHLPSSSTTHIFSPRILL
jgi:hypothetical protein